MNSYTTKDFYAAAYLVASGVDLQAYRKTKEGLTLFVFQNNEILKQLVNNYFSAGSIVNPMKYGNAIRNLKGIIHKTDSESYYVEQLSEPTK
jgi:hypothetical protein